MNQNIRIVNSSDECFERSDWFGVCDERCDTWHDENLSRFGEYR